MRVRRRIDSLLPLVYRSRLRTRIPSISYTLRVGIDVDVTISDRDCEIFANELAAWTFFWIPAVAMVGGFTTAYLQHEQGWRRALLDGFSNGAVAGMWYGLIVYVVFRWTPFRPQPLFRGVFHLPVNADLIKVG